MVLLSGNQPSSGDVQPGYRAPKGNRVLRRPTPAPQPSAPANPLTGGYTPSPEAPVLPGVPEDPGYMQATQEMLFRLGQEKPAFDPEFNVNSVPEAQADLDKLLDSPKGPLLPEIQAPPKDTRPYGALTDYYSGNRRPAPQSQADSLSRGYAALGAPVMRERNISEARETLSEAERGERVNSLKLGRDRPDTKVMTQEDYNNLTPRQRAAVDFNTSLVKAVRTDKRMQDEYKPDDATKDDYNAAVEDLFGEGRGSDLYAPETMALLRQIKFRDDSADLDDFLGLNAAVSQKQLKFLSPPEKRETLVEGKNPVQLDRVELTEEIAQNTLDMQRALVKGNEIIGSITRTMTGERREDVANLGGVEREVRAPLGYGEERWLDEARTQPGDVNTFFKQTFDILADQAAQGQFDDYLSRAAGALKPEEMDAFMQYADARTKNAMRYKVALGEGDINYVKPEVLRQRLGLDKGGDRG